MKKYSKELKDFAESIYDNNLWSLIYRKNYKHSHLYNQIINETRFLNVKCKIKERVYCIRHDKYDDILCPTCGVPSKLNKRKDEPGFCDTKCSSMYIDLNTGKTTSQLNGLKSYNTKISKIDKFTGLSLWDATILKISNTKNKIDPKTGLSNAQLSGRVQSNTLNIIDPLTGLSIAQVRGLKTKITNSRINHETGLCNYDIISSKIKNKLLEIDDNTGLSIAQVRGLKTKITNSTIDPETGLCNYDIISSKIKDKMIIRDENTGLTGYQRASIKSAKSLKLNTYYKIVDKFPNGYTILTTSHEYVNSKCRILTYSCDICNSQITSYYRTIRCFNCDPYIKSMGEHEVLEFCQSLISEVQSNPRNIISPLELDVYIPEYNVAIEYNGLFWHSSDSIETESKDYHLYKTDQCKSKDIQLFHIFEHEWQDDKKREIWKSIIRNKLGNSQRIFARKTIVTRITSKETKAFLDINHLQGTCVSSVNLGLIYDDELVAVMTFGRSRYDKKIEWELLRYCGKLNTSVVGGASKLLKAFRRDNEGSIISYADKRRSNGNLYEKLGFELSHESSPNYWYYKDFMKLESRIGYQKHKLKDKLEVFDDNLTESENMYINGYRKIFDCGNQVWKLK